MDFEQRPVFWIEKMESFLVYTLVSNVNYEREEAKRHRDSHEDMLDDCICGFGAMLYLALKSHYFVSRNGDDREDAVDGNAQVTHDISYPGLALITIARLSESVGECVNFLWRLLWASGDSEGSPYFFIYNYPKKQLDPLRAVRKMQWKLLLPWCLVVPLLKLYYFERRLRAQQEMNRACLYFLDIPVIWDREHANTLRHLMQAEDDAGVVRNVRARVDPDETLARVCLKFVAYDCCSSWGRNAVTFDSLSSIFYSLEHIVENVQVCIRILSNCDWNGADVAALCFFLVFWGSYVDFELC